MARIVIAGSGFGGLTAAMKLKKHLDLSRHQITVIDQNAQFVYRPSLVLVAFGKATPESITFNLPKVYQQSGIQFIQASISSIDGDKKIVETSKGPVNYDKLIVALGEKLAYEEIPGLKEYGYNVCTMESALSLKQALSQYQGGPVVVGWAQNVQTGGPAFEVALELSHYITHHHLTGTIQFIDPLPKLWAPAGPKASEFLAKVFATHHIKRQGPVQVRAVQKDRVILSNGEELPSVLTIITPPFRGEPAQQALVANNARGWLETEKDMQSIHYPDIYVVGSAVAFEGPKQGHTAMLQAEVAAYNIAQDLESATPKHREYDHEMSCVLDLGDGQGLFVRQSLWSKEHQVVRVGREWPLAKKALAFAFVRTPVFKKWALSLPQPK
ncbi:NAD(P)/FAD-dependent oxidoreductase [Sulfobacillus thermosulfidooxidans]|uniref:NAD(P)/FAD-dependent oxidoreductase n=1 Tax=Sulfobacillus thermosulfidooxidans TaxID=28034 RepID=UPI00096BB432|nr:FAD-dependent oxidoreductase [Sulfobacillus thermosulfidooxidans]OLZ09216.1 sulfide-quinone oxidoreductase [Sulfobacillus thermosulfidooxidans]OLZ17781.1 sulfide-quinone oxidoreductase [Sulfobacillus thermosulfidooxidans]OLZ22327.1 sulfide-quinone oxidoreductase [Sulfobacillus thermosulfidooxidans]